MDDAAGKAGTRRGWRLATVVVVTVVTVGAAFVYFVQPTHLTPKSPVRPQVIPFGDAVGYASYMRIEPVHRVIEVGSILYTPRLQRTIGATEAMYLMARHVFEDLGYRRYEWKCNALNAPSRSAALRLGFTFEGIFRQHMIIKGRNLDTAWFSMLDSEWPQRKAAFERWLDPSNFDANGRQRQSLAGAATEAGPG